MPEEIKIKILEFLKERAGEEFSVLNIKRGLEKWSYNTVLKWVTVLAEGNDDVIIKDHGNIKLVSYIGE